MADEKRFDADARMKEHTSRQIVIGEKEWYPAKRTGNVAKKIAELGDPPESDGTPAALSAAMDYLYKNLAILLVDADKQHPDFEWLLEELEWDVAQDLLGFLNPEVKQAMEAAGGQGNGSAAAPVTVPLQPETSNSASSATFRSTTTSS